MIIANRTVSAGGKSMHMVSHTRVHSAFAIISKLLLSCKRNNEKLNFTELLQIQSMHLLVCLSCQIFT